MFEMFSDRGLNVLRLAHRAALQVNYEYIGTEHILLALGEQGDGKGFEALENLGVD